MRLRRQQPTFGHYPQSTASESPDGLGWASFPALLMRSPQHIAQALDFRQQGIHIVTLRRIVSGM
jgi:hypothetical protein